MKIKIARVKLDDCGFSLSDRHSRMRSIICRTQAKVIYFVIFDIVELALNAVHVIIVVSIIIAAAAAVDILNHIINGLARHCHSVSQNCVA